MTTDGNKLWWYVDLAVYCSDPFPLFLPDLPMSFEAKKHPTRPGDLTMRSRPVPTKVMYLFLYVCKYLVGEDSFRSKVPGRRPCAFTPFPNIDVGFIDMRNLEERRYEKSKDSIRNDLVFLVPFTHSRVRRAYKDTGEIWNDMEWGDISACMLSAFESLPKRSRTDVETTLREYWLYRHLKSAVLDDHISRIAEVCDV